MPAIVVVPQVVEELLDQFGNFFPNEPSRRHFAEYVTGLLVAEHKTVSGIAREFACPPDQSALNRWLNEAPPIACAVFVGRTLEFLCKDRAAKDSTLEKMLKDLATRGEIPPRILDLADSLRYFCNIGAHAINLRVTKQDAKTLIAICEAILKYVYEAPLILEQVQDRINQLKATTNSTSL